MNWRPQTDTRFTLPSPASISPSAASVRLLLSVLALCWLAFPAAAKVTNSVTNGNWSAPATWDNGVPADGDQITIQAAHAVTLDVNVNFTTAGSTLTVNGTLDLGTFTCKVATTNVNAGANVVQNTTIGLPVAANLTATTLTLSPTSTYSYTGNQTGFTGVHPFYGNLKYASSTANNGTLDVNLKVNGDMTINMSGSGEIRFGSGANHSHTIAGTLTLTAGNVVGSSGSANVAIDINGNWVINSTAAFKACAAAGNLTVNLAGNYTQNGTLSSPGAGVFNLILDGSGGSTLSGTAALSLPNLTMSKTGAAGATLTQHLTVTKNLNFINGKITIGNFNLTLAALATTSGASGTGYVETNGNGKMIFAQGNPGTDFPVGNGSYTPMSIATTPFNTAFGVRVADGFLAELSGCNGFVTDDAVKKMWFLTRESGTATLLSVNLQWNGSDEGTTFNRNVCGVVRYLSGDWETAVPNTATGADPYKRGRLFSGVFDGVFGVIDTSSLVNLTAPAGTSNSPVCAGQTLNFTRTSTNVTGATYQWSKLGGGFNPPAGPNASLNNAQSGDTGNYLLTMSKYGCNFTSTAVPAIVNDLPVCNIGGDVQVCSNTTGHVYSAPAGMTNYAWTITGTGTIAGASNAQNVTVNAGAAGSYALNLSITNQNNCTAACSLQVQVLPRPTGLLSGSATICAGDSVTLSIAVTGNGPWSGTLSGGIPFSGSSSPIFVKVAPAGNTTYTLASLSDSKCTATPNDLSGSATITIDVLQMFQVTGGGSFCAGGAGVPVGLSGSESGVQYLLYLDNSFTGNSQAGTGGAISFGLQSSPGSYTVIGVRNSTQCEKQMTGSVAVSILPLPMVTLVLGDDQALVSETSVPLTGGNPPGGTYSGPGVSGGIINPFAAGIGVHTITYTATDNNGCSNTATDTFTVLPDAGVNLLVEAPPSAECGQKFTVDIVSVTGFDTIGTLQFSVGWDLNTFMLMGTDPTVVGGFTPLTGIINDTLIYSWLDDSPPYGVSLPPDTTLLRLTFKALHCGTNGKISIVGTPRVIEASDGGLNVIPVTVLNTNEIQVNDTQPPVFTDVPAAVTVECTAIPGVGEPAATDNCDTEPVVTYNGETTTPGACAGAYTLTRTWTATDACDNSATTAQVISVVDTTPPTFSAPADITIALDAQCFYDASVAITGDVTNEADICSPPNSLNATFTDVVSVGPGSNVLILRTWTLTDACDNTASGKEQAITILDMTPPTITCPQDQVVVSGNANCIFTVQGSTYDPATADNCGVASIHYALSGASNSSGNGSLNGVTLPVGNNIVTWTVTDVNGLTASCSFILKVSDCAGISGKLIWEGDDASGVAQATVHLSGDAVDTDGPTAADGLYTLVGGSTGNFVVTPLKPAPPAAPLNGVTAADALAIQQHLSGMVPITDPYKLIAADVNLSNSVTINDALTIRQAVLGSAFALEFFINKPWKFVPTPDPGPGFPGYTPPANPFISPIPETRVLTGVAGGATNQNFFGIKTGDVNASANPLLHPGPSDALTLLVPDAPLVAGQEVRAVFAASHFNELAAFQFALGFDQEQLALLAVEPSASPLQLNVAEHFGLYQLNQGEIRSLWIGDQAQTLPEGMELFVLRFRALQSGALLSSALHLAPKVMVAEAYTPLLERTAVQLVFTETTRQQETPAEQAGVRLLQNRPNPFAGSTTIGFILPEACTAQLRVLDATGRELLRRERTYAAGYQEERIQAEWTTVSGILYYELTTPYGQLTRRMVVVQR